MPALTYIRNPNRLGARHARIIECLIAMNRAGDSEATTECIRMCKDLRENGRESRYIKKLKDLPGVFELKSRPRGGFKGGARVYFFWLPGDRPVLANAEYKHQGADASEELLEEVLDMMQAVREGKIKP